jgi:Co/Zn/Cd efflux system component
MKAVDNSLYPLRRAVLVVALLNASYFAVEFAVATHIGSVSLFADSIDFLEDTAVNLLIFTALAWTPAWRARVGMGLAGVLLLPTIALLWTLWGKFTLPIPPAPVPLSLTGGGALVVNLACAFMLVGYRHQSGSLTRAAFLSARNDAYANVAIVVAGLLTAAVPSVWPDVLVGLGIAALNADAAREIWSAARNERRTTVAAP